MCVCVYVGVVRKRILPFTTVKKEPTSSSSSSSWTSLDNVQLDCISKLLLNTSNNENGFVFNEVGIGGIANEIRSGRAQVHIRDNNNKVIGDVLGMV